MSIIKPVIPINITVHLGTPDSNSNNITVLFTDYIKNVASSEIYPTWPKESLKANIYAIISFTLNRIYNEWYRSKGYNFDITSSQSYDQKYTKDRSIYSSISDIVDEIFDEYIVKNNQIQPLFATYCDGRNKTCNGLSQWGTVELANKNKLSLDILKYYYGNDIRIVTDAEIKDVKEYFPGYNLKLGSEGNPVIIIERELNRISKNYPAIPVINDKLGIYTEEVVNAVKKFQEIFNLPITGIVDKGTWYKIRYVFNSVTKLGELYTEGLNINDVTFLYNDVLKYGDTGLQVEYVAYFLNSIAFLNPNIINLPLSNVFDENFLAMVKSFKKEYKLDESDIFTYNDWKVLKNVYDTILNSYPNEYKDYVMDLYPNYFLTLGVSGNDVKRLQMFLYNICVNKKTIPGVRVNGIFDELTKKSVEQIQKDNDIEITGVVGPITWKKIVELSK